MLTETGTVVAIDDDGLWVQTIRQSTCSRCSARQGCGHRLLNRNGRKHQLRVLLDGQAASDYRLDDEVRIAIPEQVVVVGSFVVYIVPLLLIMLGAALGSQLSGSGDWVAVVGALAGFWLGTVLLRRHGRIHRHDLASQPRLLGRVGAVESTPPD